MSIESDLINIRQQLEKVAEDLEEALSYTKDAISNLVSGFPVEALDEARRAEGFAHSVGYNLEDAANELEGIVEDIESMEDDDESE